VRPAQELCHHGAPLSLIVVYCPSATADDVGIEVPHDRCQRLQGSEQVAVGEEMVVNENGIVRPHCQAGANRFHHPLRPVAHQRDLAPMLLSQTQGGLQGELVIGIDDPFEIVGNDGFAITGDADDGLRVWGLLEHHHNIHGYPPFS